MDIAAKKQQRLLFIKPEFRCPYHMRKIYWLAVALIVSALMLNLTVGCNGDGNGDTKGTINTKGTIKGTVIDALDQSPIEGATVRASGNDSATSGSDGAYSLSIEPNVYSIRVEAQGYIPSEMFEIQVKKGKDTQCNVTMTPISANTPPNQPQLVDPPDGAIEVSLRPQLSVQAFSDIDGGTTHSQSHWQIATALSFDESALLVNSTSAHALTTLSAELIFEPETTYYWRVRFFDDLNAASEWSIPFAFTTATDTDDDQMPDQWESLYGLDPDRDDATEDPDNDGFSNLEEYCLDTDPWNPLPNPSVVIMGFVRGTVVNASTGNAVGAQLLTSGGIVAECSQHGDFLMVHPPGTYSVVVYADEYYRATSTIEVSESTTTSLDVSLPPIYRESGGGSSGAGGCFMQTIINSIY